MATSDISAIFDTCWLTVFSELNRRISKVLEANQQLTMTQYRILLELAAANGELPGNAFTNLLILKPSSVTCAFNKLENRGLISRGGMAGNRRSIVVSLNKPGKDMLDDATKDLEQVLSAAWSGLTDEQIGLVEKSTVYPFERLSGHTAVRTDSPVQVFYLTTVVILHQLWTTCLKKEFGLSLTKFRILLLLSELAEGCFLGEVAKRLVLEPSSVSGAVSSLMDDGLVELSRDLHDRRNCRVFLPTSEQSASSTFELARTKLVSLNTECYSRMPQEMVDPLKDIARIICMTFQTTH